ncbi:MAG: hypothetical protein KIT45_06245 [Fimbriimonadia bacterium]|nr:hypothetical protein [Fimbriimonadia bacterium]
MRADDEPHLLKRLFWLWFPLAVSMTLMMLEAPITQTALARLPESTLHLAAFGLALGISLVIESPVVMLLATATALVHHAQSYRALLRFTLWLCGLLTLLTGVIAFTPLFEWISARLLGAPPEIVAPAKPAMQIMLVWTAVIGWRRFYQGILVRYGETRLVSRGTVARLIAMCVTAFGLMAWGELPGSQVGALALMASVLVEAIAVTIYAQPVLREHGLLTQPALDGSEPPLTLSAITRFHMPLAGTTLLAFMVQPVTAAALARMAEPTLTLAAWPVVFGFSLITRSWGFAIQEIAIAVSRDSALNRALKPFTLLVAIGTTLMFALISFTPLASVYMVRVMSLQPELLPYVESGLKWSLLIPALTAYTSWLRGLLVAQGATKAVSWGMGLNLTVNGLLLAGGVALRMPGVFVAIAAYTIAAMAEYLFIARLARNRSALTPQAEAGVG